MQLVLGSPGPVALRLIETLVAQGQEVVIIRKQSRPDDDASLLLSQVEVLLGDEICIDFGLTGEDYNRLLMRVSHVFAVGVCDEVNGEIADCRQVRTACEICEFVRAGGAPSGVTYLSSLLVFGGCSRPVTEDELAVGQSFDGPFEQALASAERIIQRLRGQYSFSILRTGPIVGDERKGLVFEGSALTQLMRTLDDAEGRNGYIFSDLPTRWETVDRVVESLLRLSPTREGNVVHLIDTDPLTDRQLMEQLASHTNHSLKEREDGFRFLSSWRRSSFPGSRALRGWGLHFTRTAAENQLGSLLDRDDKKVLAALFREKTDKDLVDKLA